MTIPTRRDRPPAEHTRRAVVKTESEAEYAERKKFYWRAPWRKLRLVKLGQNPLCERCLKRGEAVPADTVHHVVDLAAEPDLGLVLENLESLCANCHSSETKRRQMRGTNDGQP